MMVLRYFACVGRAQPLRLALADAGVAHEDVHVALADWPGHREDARFSGQYRSLPTLTCDGQTIAETLPIAFFLAQRLGHDAGLSDLSVARLQGIISCVYIDVLVRTAELIWAEVMYPGVDLSAAFSRTAGRVLAKLERLEDETPDRFFGGERPVMADFFAAEGLAVFRHLLGPSRVEAIGARLPRLTALARRVEDRPPIARLSRPASFTARPDEPAVLERVRSLPAPAPL
jgi:glutathione S-transferase